MGECKTQGVFVVNLKIHTCSVNLDILFSHSGERDERAVGGVLAGKYRDGASHESRNFTLSPETTGKCRIPPPPLKEILKT